MGSTNFPVDSQDLISEYDLPDAKPLLLVKLGVAADVASQVTWW